MEKVRDAYEIGMHPLEVGARTRSQNEGHGDHLDHAALMSRDTLVKAAAEVVV